MRNHFRCGRGSSHETLLARHISVETFVGYWVFQLDFPPQWLRVTFTVPVQVKDHRMFFVRCFGFLATAAEYLDTTKLAKDQDVLFISRSLS